MAAIAKAVIEGVGDGVTALGKASPRRRVCDPDAGGVGIVAPPPLLPGIRSPRTLDHAPAMPGALIGRGRPRRRLTLATPKPWKRAGQA